ncbi:MAG: sigma-54 dependent transcriptional regulator [Acidobacteriia bacterium]|nr:sigma-54 dependent transcriptional regulator [Terriglobia bacterium]
MKRLLIADDDAGMRAALETRFLRRGWLVDVAVNGADALAKFRDRLHTLVITDVRMPGRDGFELMREIQSSSPRTAVILLTAYGCVPDAVEAMRNGACDYLVKPVCFEKLELAVEQVLRRAQEQNKETESLVGHSPAWQQALERARQAAATDADVLIEAESGTGKELVARLIHRLSGRREGPFVALNCTAFPEALLESELFGHARGAFTGADAARPGKFEMASGGTLLLDEVGEMPLALQPKLLRALQEREFDRLGSNQTVHVDIRVIATTNCPLEASVAGGRFRADLYYRLNVIPLALPPLRDRAGDIPELAQHFAQLYGSPGTEPRLSPDLLARLEQHAWPGNVRELANFVRRAVALSRGGEIGVEAFEHGKISTGTVLRPPEWKAGLSLGEMERRLFAMTLEATHGNRARAAELLGVSQRTVRNKIREYGFPPRSNYVHD